MRQKSIAKTIRCPHIDCVDKDPVASDYNGISYHFTKKHGIKYQDWLQERTLEKLGGVWPLCKCGCGAKVSFCKGKFREYVAGHHHKGKKFDEEARTNMSKGSQEWSDNLSDDKKRDMHAKTGKIIHEKSEKNHMETKQQVLKEKYGGAVPKCLTRGKEAQFCYKKRDFRKFCSVKCINIGRKETEEHKEKIRVNAQRAVFEKFGVNTTFKLPHLMKHRKVSKAERRLSEVLGAHLGFDLEHKSYDMIIGNTIIEVEGDFYHPDKLENLTMIQANNIVNDHQKLEITKRYTQEYELLKIREPKVKEIGFENISIDVIRSNTYKQDFSIYNEEQILMNKEYFERLKIDPKADRKLKYCVSISLKFIRYFLPDFSEIDDAAIISALIAIIGDEENRSRDLTIKTLKGLVDTDQFFTKEDVAKHLVETLGSIVDFSYYDHIIEPSAGDGSFSLLFDNCEAYDIFPRHASITKTDFLELDFVDYERQKTLIVGNPPFGKQSSLDLGFLRKTCEITDTVAFILPRSFKKDSMRDKVPLTHSCVFEMDLNSDSFEKDGVSREIQCVFQVWIRKDRKKSEQYCSKDFAFCSKDKAQFSFRRAGAKAGEISKDVSNKNESSHYFIKTKENDDAIMKILESIDWTNISLNTVAVKSISTNEIYMKYLEEAKKRTRTQRKSF